MGMLGVLMALLAGYMLWQMSELNNITSVLAHRNVPVSELAGEIKNLSINNFPISLPESDEGSSQMRESQVS